MKRYNKIVKAAALLQQGGASGAGDALYKVDSSGELFSEFKKWAIAASGAKRELIPWDFIHDFILAEFVVSQLQDLKLLQYSLKKMKGEL